MKIITSNLIKEFKSSLICEEKSSSTLEKYIRDVTAFMHWLDGRTADKSFVMEYKQALIENYAPASVNTYTSDGSNQCKGKYVKVNGKYKWSEPQLCSANWTRYFADYTPAAANNQ